MSLPRNIWKDDRAYSLTSHLRQLGSNQWQVDLEPYLDEIIEVSIVYQNTSGFQQSKTVIYYELADGLEVVPDSGRIIDPNRRNGSSFDIQKLFESGLEIGDYAPQARAEIYFQVRPSEGEFDAHEGTCVLFNHARAEVRGASMQKYVRNIIYLKCRNAPTDSLPPIP